MYEVFRAGVEPGGLTADYEIKILICYILRELGSPMLVSGLIEAIVGEGIGNYFEVANAASLLIKSGHISIFDEKGKKYYMISPLGTGAADTFEKDIPASVREKAMKAAKHFCRLEKNRVHNHAEVTRVQDGYLLTLTITDVGSDLLTITILLPDQETCDKIKTRFYEDPIVVYKGVVAVLTGSMECLDGLAGHR